MSVAVKNLQNKVRLTDAVLSIIKKSVNKTLKLYGKKSRYQITLCLVNNRLMRKLNYRHLGKDASTDVIAFNLGGTADIAISTDAALANAKIFKTAPLYELCLYAVHGTLHILGYDDRTAVQRRRMENKAEAILAGIKPYVHP